MRVDPIGVYPVEAPEPCHLIEVWLRGVGDVNVGEFTQELPNDPPSSWQVPYNERLLNDEGTAGELCDGPVRCDADQRVAFFFHYLQEMEPLRTPWGQVVLPEPSPRPERLAFI